MSNEERLQQMLATYGGAVRRIARAYAGRDGEEEDLYQEILLQLWRSLPSYRGDAAAGTWLYRVSLNTALTWRRRSQRRVPTVSDSVDVRAPSASPAARTEAAILEEFLAARKPADRTVLLLYMEGLSYDEIADVTGLSSGAVGVRLHRMKHAFTEQYVG